METKKILMLSTGGTIAGNVANKTGKKTKHTTSEDFKKNISHTIENIKEKWGIIIDVEPKALISIDNETVDVDSSNIMPDHWTAIISTIKREYDNYHGFIITHGTNTLGYTSAALSFAFANINKPVILTGSQVPFGRPGSDALTNLDNALRVSVWPYDKIRGVIVVFGSNIITGVRAKKSTEFDYDAFKSFSSSSLGEVGRIIVINQENLLKHNNYYTPINLESALTADDLVTRGEFDTQIASLTEFPGMPVSLFQTLVENENIKGFILRASGAGDPSSRLIPAFEFLKENNIPIVVTTQAPNGNANFQVNEPGQYLKQHDLALPAYNMSIEAITTKLSWLIAQYPILNPRNYDLIKQGFLTNVKGEINILTERRQ